MIGQTLKSYLIEAMLGKGGMGEVYRARDTKLDRNVAIKEESISPDVGLKASLGNRFELPQSTQIGFILGGTYDNVWRETQRKSINITFPDERTDTVDRSIEGRAGVARRRTLPAWPDNPGIVSR